MGKKIDYLVQYGELFGLGRNLDGSLGVDSTEYTVSVPAAVVGLI